MGQFNHLRMNSHLFLFQEGEQLPQVLPVVVIADRRVNGDARKTNWLNKPEELFVLGYRSSAHGAVTIDDHMSGQGIEGD